MLDDSDDLCGTCGGCGEGMYDGSSCSACGGSGCTPYHAEGDDDPRIDAAIDAAEYFRDFDR